MLEKIHKNSFFLNDGWFLKSIYLKKIQIQERAKCIFYKNTNFVSFFPGFLKFLFFEIFKTSFVSSFFFRYLLILLKRWVVCVFLQKIYKHPNSANVK